MRVFLLVLLVGTVLVTAGKKKGDSRASLGYKECSDYKDSYKREGKQNKELKWVRPKPLSEICGVDGECPEVEELANSHCGFGIREIVAGNWVSTEVRESDGESKYDRAFMRLNSYISGPGNDQGATIPMTYPVVVQIELDEEYEEEGGTMHFYLPLELQENPPIPTSEEVEIQDWDDVVVYYRAFGYKGKDVTQEVWDREFKNLGDAITDAGLSSYWGTAITATFSQPGVGDQRYEAMFLARRHYQHSYDGDEYSWEQARGYKECAQFPNTVKPKAVEGICGKDARCPEVEDVDSEICGFGVRNIKAGKWASTEILDSDGDQKYLYAFMRLFSYIRGENEDSKDIEMTIPIITKTYLDREFEESWASMHFYLPPEYHDNPPSPSDDLVEVEEWIDTITYYRTVGDYDDDTDVKALWDKEFEDLSDVLTKAEESFYPYLAVTATFTRPGYGDQRHEAIYLSWDQEEEEE